MNCLRTKLASRHEILAPGGLAGNSPDIVTETRSTLVPVLSVIAGIASFSAMDAAMKSAALVIGVYSALLFRNLAATAITVPIWLARGRPLPRRAVLVVHVQRSATTTVMAALFFYGLVRLPMAEGLAISFISPLVALYFAALLLGETIRRSAILASVLGLVGVLVISAGRFGAGEMSDEAALGTAAILCSAMFYALNLVLQRKQAMLAGPVEVALFQNLLVVCYLLPLAPFMAVLPAPHGSAVLVAGGALATLALLLLSWGYARAEAQVLVPVEYTGFLWAALLGWLVFGERVSAATIAGAVLIVIGCLIATRNHTEQTKV